MSQYPNQQTVPYQPYSNQPGMLPIKGKNGLGITSVILAVLAGVIDLILVIVAGVMVSKQAKEDSPEMVAVGLGLLLGMLMALVGGILGIIGLFLPNRSKISPVVGTILNGLVLLVLIGLMILG